MDITAAVSHTTSACLLLLCCLSVHHLYTGCDAASTAFLQAINCSTAGNYTPADAYAANLNLLLAALPDNTVRKNGGFFNGTAGQPGAPGTAYVLALCFISDLSRPDCHDCHDCLAAATSNSGGLVDRCPGSTTVVATYDRCLVHYSDAGFFGTPYTDAVYKWDHPGPVTNQIYARILARIALLNQFAANKPARSGHISSSSPYMLVQCTWDLPPDKCKACLDILRSKIPRSPAAESKTPSCRLSYSIDSLAIFARSSSTDASSSTPPKNDKGAGSPSRSISTGAVVGTVISIIVAVPSFVACLVCCLRKRRRHHRLNEMRSLAMIREGTQTAECSVQEATQVHTGRPFSYEQLLDATGNFSGSRQLGRGYFGAVYEAVLDNDRVAVKRILKVDEQAQRNYANEIRNISQLSHPNLVPFVGSCDDRGELLLVYKLIPNGSLDEHLHGEKGPLKWDYRYKVAIDIATALDHLHRQCILHRDIKPSNVMLDEHFNAKVGDFGLVRRIHRDNTSETMTITGDLGYIDPESIRTGRAGKASDIYSFGVVLLEIASGRRPACRPPQDPNVNILIEKVRGSYTRNALVDAVDGRLNGDFIMEQVQRVMHVGLLCVEDNHKRPNCTQVLNYLSGTAPVPPPQRDQDSLAIQVDVSIPKEYTFDQLSVATNHFGTKLGSGGFAVVYNGKLGQTSVAVKRMLKVNHKAIRDFRTEIQVICQLRHRNLLPLVGWYAHSNELLVVYELMQNGSLSDHLHRPDRTVHWNQRFNIITGIASAVAYLHEGTSLQTVLHRDIKPSNVMLDEKYTAKLGDFGLVRQIDDDASTKTATFGGTIHYMDPEYFKTIKASKESDVFSFGVVALEMVLGEKPRAFENDEGQLRNSFVQKALHLYENQTIFGMVDKQLNGDFDENQMKRVIHAGVLCVNPDRKKRPSCMSVKNYLEGHASELEPSPSSSMSRQDSSDYKTCSSSFRKLEMVREAD